MLHGPLTRQFIGRRLLATIGFIIAFVAIGSSSPDGEIGIVRTFLSRSEPVLHSYVAHRTLIGWAEGTKKRGRMQVRTEFDGLRRTLEYTVLQEEGSSLVRQRGLHAVLRAEAEAVKAGRMARSALTAENYDIASAGPLDEEGLYRLSIDPRRSDGLLVRGSMFVTADGDLIRVRGRLAKNPSLWTTRVDVTREYARIAGVTLLVRVESKVRTRLFGTGRFLMTYHYDRVNDLAVNLAAKNQP